MPRLSAQTAHDARASETLCRKGGTSRSDNAPHASGACAGAKLACGATLSATREFVGLAWVLNLLVVAVMITTRELLAPFVATPFISRDNYPTNLCYSPYVVTQKSAKSDTNFQIFRCDWRFLVHTQASSWGITPSSLPKRVLDCLFNASLVYRLKFSLSHHRRTNSLAPQSTL